MGIKLMSIGNLCPGANFDAYVQTVSDIPLLTAQEEKVLSERLFYEGNVDAARQLVMSHLRFVVHIARSYGGYGLPIADLVQEGNLGLMKAVRRFDPTRGVRLVSFAVHWIKAEIHEFILRNWRIVKVATTKAQRKLFFNLRSTKKSLGWLNNADLKGVAKDLGVSAETVRQMEGRMASKDVHFDVERADDTGNQTYQAPAQYLKSSQEDDPGLVLEEKNWRAHVNGALEQALSTLDARSRDVISQRWLSEKKVTLHDLASQYGVSAERIRQLEVSAMKKIKGQLEFDMAS